MKRKYTRSNPKPFTELAHLAGLTDQDLMSRWDIGERALRELYRDPSIRDWDALYGLVLSLPEPDQESMSQSLHRLRSNYKKDAA